MKKKMSNSVFEYKKLKIVSFALHENIDFANQKCFDFYEASFF